MTKAERKLLIELAKTVRSLASVTVLLDYEPLDKAVKAVEKEQRLK